MKFVEPTIAFAACFVCAGITLVMALSGIMKGRVFYLYGRPPLVLKERPCLFLILCSLYLTLALLYTVGAIAYFSKLYRML